MAPKTRHRLAMPRKGQTGHRSRREKEPLCPPGEPLEAVQVSLGFDRAHHKVWEFFRAQSVLILAFRRNAHGRLSEMHEGQKVIAYVPQSQGGFGLVGLGTLTGLPIVLEQGVAADGLGSEFRALMRGVYSDPSNKPVKRPRCSYWRFKTNREQIVGKGCGGTASTPWEFGVERWAGDDKFQDRRKVPGAFAVHLPMKWEATVPYEEGLFSMNWSSLGLADFPFQVCQLSSIFHRRLTTEHWAVMSARLQAVCSSPPQQPLPGPEEEAPEPAEEELPVEIDADAEPKEPSESSSKEPQTNAADPKEPPTKAADPKERTDAEASSKEEPCVIVVEPKEPCAAAAEPKEIAERDERAAAVAAAFEEPELRRTSRRRRSMAAVPDEEEDSKRLKRARPTEFQAAHAHLKTALQALRSGGPPRPPAPSAAERAERAEQRASWTSLDDLLKSLGLDKYIEQLRAEEVDLAALGLLSDRDLADLGLPLGPRRKLQAAMAADKK